MLRAVAAKAGIYANTTEEATYPFTRTDADGRDARRQQGRYTLTFPAGPAAAGQRLLVGDDVRRPARSC